MTDDCESLGFVLFCIVNEILIVTLVVYFTDLSDLHKAIISIGAWVGLAMTAPIYMLVSRMLCFWLYKRQPNIASTLTLSEVTVLDKKSSVIHDDDTITIDTNSTSTTDNYIPE